MKTELSTFFPELDLVKNRKWVTETCQIWQELMERSEWDSLTAVPFGIKTPDISLISHTQTVLSYAMKLANTMQTVHHYNNIDMDILIISCILHDVDKLLVTAPNEDGSIRLTDIGLDYQHGFFSAYYAEFHGLPSSIVTLLINHTTFSALAPDSIEGMILIMADLCDAELIRFSRQGTSSLLSALGKSSNRQKLRKTKQ